MSRPRSEHGETPKHNVRVQQQLWDEAKAAAKADGRTITDVVVKALEQYVAKYRAHRVMPISEEIGALFREVMQGHPRGSIFPPKTAKLRTFIPAGRGMVLLDSTEVSALLRALGASYRAPVHAAVRADLDELADALDMQALQALDASPGGGAS